MKRARLRSGERVRIFGESGQSTVEMAIVAPILVVLLLVGVQFAILGNAVLALSQLAYAGARYAAVNPTADQSMVSSYMESIASPILHANSGALSISLNPSSVPRQFGNPVTVTINADLSSELFLPNPFLGISFPTTISNVQTTMMGE